MRVTFALIFLMFNVGCASVNYDSLDARLQSSIAQRNDIRDWDEHMKVMVSLNYASAAYKASQASIEAPSPEDYQALNVPFAIYNFAIGADLAGSIGLLDWFNAGMTGANHRGYYFDREFGFMVNPNTLYFRFNEGNSEPSPDRLRKEWSHAHALFEQVIDPENKCVVWGWSEKQAFNRTYPKDVPGKYKEVLYSCPHPLIAGINRKVFVTAWANPVEGFSTIAAVQPQCWVKAEVGQKFRDTRGCGIKLADTQRNAIPDSREWMELVVTPVPESPELLRVETRYKGERRILQAPAPSEAYVSFLKSRPYRP